MAGTSAVFRINDAAVRSAIEELQDLMPQIPESCALRDAIQKMAVATDEDLFISEMNGMQITITPGRRLSYLLKAARRSDFDLTHNNTAPIQGPDNGGSIWVH